MYFLLSGLLRYSLCPPASIRRLYESLILVLKYKNRPLRNSISRLIITLTEEKHVTKWRIKFIKSYLTM